VWILLALLLAVSACAQPCPYVCGDNGDCPLGFVCVEHQACLAQCPMCGNACVTDLFHNCGACGSSCAAGQVCSKGICTGACDTGLTRCDVGSCYDLQTNRQNCGACGHLCASNETCNAGACHALISCG
jgi:hypothetical protein